MALILKDLHQFQFERSIDWRVRIPFLSVIEPEILTVFPTGDFFCRSVDYPTSEISVIDDNLGLPGSYKSVKTVPDIRIELFSDSALLLEKALVKWSLLAYDENGAMPLPIHDLENQAVQHIEIDRINPVDIASVAANLVVPLNIDLPTKVIKTHKFQGYLENAPKYSGTDSAEIRVLEVNIKVTSLINPINTESIL